MTLKTTLAAITVLLSATTVLLAQSMPNYGPNAPSTGDSFGKPAERNQASGRDPQRIPRLCLSAPPLSPALAHAPVRIKKVVA
jgi:hypothetical protein